MEIIVGAAVTAVGGVIVALIQRSRKENRTDHAMVVNGLNRIETKIDSHINDHATGKFIQQPDEVVVVVPAESTTVAKKPRAPRKAAAPKPATAPKKKAG